MRLSLTLASSSVGSTTLTWTPTEYAMLDSHGSGAAQVHICRCRRALTYRKHGCAKTLQLCRRMSWATPPPMNSKSQQGCSTARRFFNSFALGIAGVYLPLALPVGPKLGELFLGDCILLRRHSVDAVSKYSADKANGKSSTDGVPARLLALRSSPHRLRCSGQRHLAGAALKPRRACGRRARVSQPRARRRRPLR